MSAKQLTWEEAVQWLRDQPEQQNLVKDCYYDDPLESVADRFSNSEEWLAVQQLLENHIPGKVLDIGAGRGISSYAFAKCGCQVTALEPDPSFLVGFNAIQSLVNNTQLPIQIVQEYGETIPFQDSTFDIVYGRAVLHHAQDLHQLCKEAARVLKPGGIFLATREHVISNKVDLPKFLESHALQFLYGGENAFLLKEYQSAITSAGLKIQKNIEPYESVINYAPMNQKEFSVILASKLARFTGQKLANRLAGFDIIQRIAGWYVSKTLNTPGRHYSFLAVK
jgi:ubiquinone/menaquinone biosynthesis C-methylase UbiE